MKAQPVTARGLAFLLSLSLGFPPGASALRQTGLEESDSAKEKLLESLTAGLEEPPVVSTITKFFRFPRQLDWLLAQMTPKVEEQEPINILCLGSGKKEPATIASFLLGRYGKRLEGKIDIYAVDSNDGVYREMVRHFRDGEPFDLSREADARPGINEKLSKLNETMPRWRQWIHPVHSPLEDVADLYPKADAVFLNMVAYQLGGEKQVLELLAKLKPGARIYTRFLDAEQLGLYSDRRFHVWSRPEGDEQEMVFQRAPDPSAEFTLREAEGSAAGLPQKGAPVNGPPKGGLETSGLEEGVLEGILGRMPDPGEYTDVEKWLDAVHGPAYLTGPSLADDVAWKLLERNFSFPEGERSAFWKQLAEEVSGKAGQLKPLEAVWLAEIFEHLTEQFVPLEGRGPVAEILDLVVKRRVPEAAENVRLEEVKGFEFPDTLPGFLLEKEGLKFAPLFALIRAKMGRIKIPPFAGVVETEKEKAALIEILSISDKMPLEERTQVVEAKRILRRMIQSAESFGGGEKGYEEATRLAKSRLLGLVLTPIEEAEPNLLRQLNQLLGRFGYRLSLDRATQEAALILLYAA